MEWRGIAYITLWYLSITSGFLALCCPTVPLMFVCPHAFRYIIGIIFSMWEMYPTVSNLQYTFLLIELQQLIFRY